MSPSHEDYTTFLTGKITGKGLPYSMGGTGVIDLRVKDEIRAGHFNHCFTCGTVVPNSAFNQHHDYHLLTEAKRKKETVSQVSWCDEGDHAFKAGEEGSVDYSAAVIVEGQRVTKVMDACKEHSPFRNHAAEARQQLEAAYPIPSVPDDVVSKSYL